METKKELMRGTALACVLVAGAFATPAQGAEATPVRPQGTCDIYAAAGTPCAAAHSTTRALYASYNGPLYQVVRWSDGKTLDIGVVQPSKQDGGGYADAAAQDAFCAGTFCSISVLYDQSGHHNDLKQPPRGGFQGPSLGGFDNLPRADMAPVTVMGHKAYGVFIAPGMGLRQNDAKGTAVDDQAEGMYWVINGAHFNNGCCFDYGNGEIDSRDDGNGTMETLYFGNSTGWIHGVLPGPWIMTDQENNLVGCVNDDHSKLCPALPAVKWRFATAMAKGKPHVWAMMVGDAQKPDSLKVTYEGKRVDGTYDPMRKQGAILLGNGGDNSNGSQGTFYEGAMTAAGTYPTEATEQAVEANIVSAGYGVATVSVAPAAAADKPAGLQTFAPGTSQDTTVTYTNTTDKPVQHVKLRMIVPQGWQAVVKGTDRTKLKFDTVAPGASVKATFTITSAAAAFNGDITAHASWHAGEDKLSSTAIEKVRNVSPVKINEFRVSDGSSNVTNSFVELYNAGDQAADVSGWSLTEHAAQLPVFSDIKLPAGTTLAPHSFYLLGLSDSGLVTAADAGADALFVRSIEGMKAGDTVVIGSGTNAETRKIAKIGTAATDATTLWQPAETPWLEIPAGSANIPVENTAGFKVGEKIALGYGSHFPLIGRDTEKYEIATVTAVGKPGTQAYLEADAPAGSTILQTMDLANISVGDRIRLDIDSKDHGIETVTVKHVGTAAQRTYIAQEAKPGARSILVGSTRDWWGGPKLDYKVGAKLDIGTPGNRQQVTITRVKPEGRLVRLSFKPALKARHINNEFVVQLGSGIELTAPLKFSHAANLPFSDRGTGISFAPATKVAHLANEPVRALGTGITLDTPLSKSHAADAVVQDATVKTAGYQGKKTPDQMFGGPVLSVHAGSMVLRDAAGNVADSINYGHYANNGNLVDPWAAEGYQAESGEGKSGCFIVTPGSPVSFPPLDSIQHNISAGRVPDGQDTDSNCTDFREAAGTLVQQKADAGTKILKVASVTGFSAGQSVIVGAGDTQEAVKIAAIGTPGVSKTHAAVKAGATKLSVVDPRNFTDGQEITIGAGKNFETAIIASHDFGPNGPEIILKAPLTFAHAAGDQVSGTGITLTTPLKYVHTQNTSVVSNLPTPGVANVYTVKP